MKMLPEYLYRGDADPGGLRQLKATWNTGFLLTNLASGGSGRDIFVRPLVQAVQEHVESSWEKTHFLSFTESRTIAEKFARSGTAADLVPVGSESWDCAIITASCAAFDQVKEVGPGFYVCTYPGRKISRPDAPSFARMLANTNRQGVRVPILLVDVVTYLRAKIRAGSDGLEQALEKALGDREWLFLPLEVPREIPGELSALLDDGCISRFERLAIRVSAN